MPSAMKHVQHPSVARFSGSRRTILVLLTACISFWTIAQYSDAFSWWRWQQTLRNGATNASTFEPLGSPPNNALSLTHAARLASEHILPPDLEKGEAWLLRALHLEPQDSDIWFHLAIIRVLQQRDREASAALAMSDSLAPLLTRQRLEAIDLWGILDRPDEALAAALPFAQGNQAHRTVVAQRLAASGMAPVRIYQGLGGPDLSPDECALLLRAISSRDPRSMQALIEALPAHHRVAPAVRSESARIALGASSHAMAIELWKERGTSLHHAPSGVLLENSDLASAPPDDAFPLGWSYPAQGSSFEARWQDADAEGVIAGRGLLLTTGASVGSASAMQYWDCYALVIPASNHPVTVQLNARAYGSADGRLQLRAHFAGRWISGNVVVAQSLGNDPLSLTIPPLPEITHVVLRLELRGGDSPGASVGATHFLIESIQLTSGVSDATP